MTVGIVLDTNVFTATLRRERELSARYAKHVVGAQLAITPQTVAEARYGALKAGWGPKRVTEVDQMVRHARLLPVDRETIEQVAQTRSRCRAAGHPLHQKEHNGDLWIAAAAVRWGLPLVAHDAVFIDCPGLELVSEIVR